MSKAARIVVPFGWKRNVESSSSTVVYISPSGITLASIVEVCQYLEKDDTCKCGLSCPIHVPKVFSFNPEVGTINFTEEEWIAHQNKSDSRMNECTHWQKLRKMRKGKNREAETVMPTTEPPPKLLIIRKDGKLRSVIPNNVSSSDQCKRVKGTDTTKRATKFSGTGMRRATAVKDLKLAFPIQFPSASTSVTSPLKSPLFEPTLIRTSTSNAKSKLQWINADYEASMSDGESENELCFSPDFKKSPTISLPPSLMSGVVIPSKSDGLHVSSTNVQMRSVVPDTVSRIGMHPNQVEAFGRPGHTNFVYPGVHAYQSQNFSQGNVKNDQFSRAEINLIRHTTPMTQSNHNFVGSALHEQGTQQASIHMSADDQRQVLLNDGASLFHHVYNSAAPGNMYNNNCPARQTAPQRLPLASPPMLNPISPFNFQINNNGMMVPRGSPVANNPSPFSNRSQSRSSSVGTPALSPGGLWQGQRHCAPESSRPMSRSSSVTTPGPDVSPGSGIGQWNANVGNNTSYNVQTPVHGFASVLSPSPMSPYPHSRFSSTPASFSRFPHDDGAPAMTSKLPQLPYQQNYAASQQLRLHSQSCQQQQNQRFEAPSSFRQYRPSQAVFGNAPQLPVLMNNGQQPASHQMTIDSAAMNPNMFRPSPPYRPPRMQFSKTCESDANSRLKFPFNSSHCLPQWPQQETGNIMQQQFVQQRWQYNAAMTPRQYFAQNMMHPRAPIVSTQRPQLRPPKPKRARKRKPKISSNKVEKVEPPCSTSNIKSEFPEIFDSQDLSSLISTSELPIVDKLIEANNDSIKMPTTNITHPISISMSSPSLVLPAAVTSSRPSISVNEMTRINTPSLLPSIKSCEGEHPFTLITDNSIPQCSERDVTTPPLPVLSPAYLFDNPESPEDNAFPDFDFNISTASKVLTCPVLSKDIDDADHCVSSPHTTVNSVSTISTVDNIFPIVSNTDSLCKQSKGKANAESSFDLISESSIVNSNASVSGNNTKDCKVVTCETLFKKQIFPASLFTSPPSPAIFTRTVLAEQKAISCAIPSSFASSIDLNPNASYTSCFQSSSKKPVTMGFRNNTHGVTSLVSSSGTLFQLPQPAKQKVLARRMSYQSEECHPSTQFNNRRRFLSEPCRSCMSSSLSTSRVSTASALNSTFVLSSANFELPRDAMMPLKVKFDMSASVSSVIKYSSKSDGMVNGSLKAQDTISELVGLQHVGVSPPPVFSTSKSDAPTLCSTQLPTIASGHHLLNETSVTHSSESSSFSNLISDSGMEVDAGCLDKISDDQQNVILGSNVVSSKSDVALSTSENDPIQPSNKMASDASPILPELEDVETTVKEVVDKLVKEVTVTACPTICTVKNLHHTEGGRSFSDASVVLPSDIRAHTAPDDNTMSSLMECNIKISPSEGNGHSQLSVTVNRLKPVAESGTEGLESANDEILPNSELTDICTDKSPNSPSTENDIVSMSSVIEHNLTTSLSDIDASKCRTTVSLHMPESESQSKPFMCSDADSTNSIGSGVSHCETGDNECAISAHVVKHIPDNVTISAANSSCSFVNMEPVSKAANVVHHGEQYKALSSLGEQTSTMEVYAPRMLSDFCDNEGKHDQGDSHKTSEDVAMKTKNVVVGTISDKDKSDDSQEVKVMKASETIGCHENIGVSQDSCGLDNSPALKSPLNIPPELTSTVIQQLSNYNTILKNLLVRQVTPAAEIAQLTSEPSNQEAKQADVISALISNTMPEMTSAQIFHKTAVTMYGAPTLPVLQSTGHHSAPFNRVGTSEDRSTDAFPCTSAVLCVSTTQQKLNKVRENMQTGIPPPDSSQSSHKEAKVSTATKVVGDDLSQQGLQVPIVSSSVKGSQEESSRNLTKATVENSQSQNEVSTSIKSSCAAIDAMPERRRGRSRTAANKQATKRQAPAEACTEKPSKRSSSSTGSSNQRGSQKQTRIVKNGDLVWGQMRGFPSWPGKVVKPTEVRGLQQRAPLPEGKVWVKWFGDHTFTQMNPADLVSMTEGLEAHHKSRRKGRTRTRKISTHLETAIQEAVDELEQQQGVSAKKFVESVQALKQPLSVFGGSGKEQQDKSKRGRKRKGL